MAAKSACLFHRAELKGAFSQKWNPTEWKGGFRITFGELPAQSLRFLISCTPSAWFDSLNAT